MTRHIFISTDLHFNHRKMVEFGRPANYEDRIMRGMNVVNPNDVLIDLGDLAVGRYDLGIEKFKTSLKKNIFGDHAQVILVRGNHDPKKSSSWYWNRYGLMSVDELVVSVEGKSVLLSHRPKAKREGIDFNVHGHTHGNAHRDAEFSPFYDEKYHIEVALENTNYRPVELGRLIKDKIKDNAKGQRLRPHTASEEVDEALSKDSWAVQLIRTLRHYCGMDDARKLPEPPGEDS